MASGGYPRRELCSNGVIPCGRQKHVAWFVSIFAVYLTLPYMEHVRW